MHGLPVLFIIALIAFFVIRAMFFSGRSAVAVPVQQSGPSYATATGDDDDADDPDLRELEEIEREERRRRSGSPSTSRTSASGAADAFEALGLPKGLGGMVGALASAAAATAVTSIVSDGDGGEALAAVQSRLRETVAQAKRSGQPLDLKSVIAGVTEAANQATTANAKRAKAQQRAARHAPSGDDTGTVLAWRPPLDARPPLVPSKPLARLHPASVLAERAPISA